MSSEGRRRARVQGGWASSAGSSRKVLNSKPSHSKPVDDTVRQRNKLDHAIHSARSDKDKPETPKQPLWTAKNVDSPRRPQRFVFEDPEEALRTKPDERFITKPGVYDLSREPSGVSRIRFFPNFINPLRSEAIFAELFHEIPWKQRSDVHNGVQAVQPRLTAWYGEKAYYYAGNTDKANTTEWPQALKMLQGELEEMTGIRFNSFATNLYRDCHDSIGWHSDDDDIFGRNPVIASLSFGDQRMFELRKKPEPSSDGERDYTYSEEVRIPLQSGALLIMEGCTQEDWQHRVPKEYHDRGARINVTFRVCKDSSSRH